MKKFVEMATIVENTAIIPEVWKMVFQAPKTASEAKAGQFVNVHRDGGQTFCAVLSVSSMPMWKPER